MVFTNFLHLSSASNLYTRLFYLYLNVLCKYPDHIKSNFIICCIYLTGRDSIPLDWNSRLKIVIGVARGLRYLHEDYRVGCIVHRDIRPKNILLTHDFEPLVLTESLAKSLLQFYLF
jgi:serine/threonine protein kinase